MEACYVVQVTVDEAGDRRDVPVEALDDHQHQDTCYTGPKGEEGDGDDDDRGGEDVEEDAERGCQMETDVAEEINAVEEGDDEDDLNLQQLTSVDCCCLTCVVVSLRVVEEQERKDDDALVVK